MKVGAGNACLIADLHMGVPDEAMRDRWKAGNYDTPTGGKPRAEFVKAWRSMAGRT